LGIGPNPQSPIPNPQSPIPNLDFNIKNKYIFIIINFNLIIIKKIKNKYLLIIYNI